MKLVPVAELFNVSYGTSLELNTLEQNPVGVPFVSRTSNNNGISALVVPPKDVELLPAGTLTVALSGNGVMSTFLQERPYLTAYHVAVLSPLETLNRDALLFYAACLQANRFRFSYGRQANRSVGTLPVPSPDAIPEWVTNRKPTALDRLAVGGLPSPSDLPIATAAWRPFKYTDLFAIVRGKGPSLAEAKGSRGATPYVTASEKNNGIATWTSARPEHPADCLTVATNGSVGECFFQPEPFAASADVAVLVPKRPMSREALLFVAALIRREGKLKYGYGRKWGAGRMTESFARLPAANGRPDTAAMEAIVRGLPAYMLLAEAEVASGPQEGACLTN